MGVICHDCEISKAVTVMVSCCFMQGRICHSQDVDVCLIVFKTVMKVYFHVSVDKTF